MSAIRNSGRRSRSLYSPYNAKGGSRKKAQSSWSFSAFFSLFNPLRSRPSEDIFSEDSGAEDDASTLPPSPLPSSAQLGETTSNFSVLDGQFPSPPQQSTSTPSPPTAAVPSAIPQLASTEDRIAAANALLQSRVNQTLRPEDLKTISAILDVPPKSQPFRFSTTLSDEKKMPSPSPQPPATTSRKLLARNPNGTYLWDGTASAKRARNRFSSPAFGSSRLASNRVTIPEIRKAEEPKSDHKRRRMGDDAAISTSESSGPKTNGKHPPAPVAAVKTAQMVPFPSGPPAPKVNGHGPTRLGLHPKATTPIVPSPLRQAWSGNSSPSQGEANPPQPRRTGSKPTKTANFMTELIKEVTPPKRPDLSNPYQAASPVAKVAPPRRPLKRARATGKPTMPSTNGDTSKDAEKKPIELYSPQAIIEATLPKGSQRSRPPAPLDKVPKPTTGIWAEPSPEPAKDDRSRPVQPRETLGPDTIEEVEDDTSPATKKQKRLIDGQRPKRNYSVTVEEIPDVEMGAATAGPSSSGLGLSSRPPAAATITTTRSLFTSFKATSIPKEPSKLRFSYQPEPAAEMTIPTKQPTPLVDTTKKSDLPVNEVEPSKYQPARTTPLSPKDAALRVPLSSLPSFAFSMVPAIPPSKTTNEVKGLPTSVLPSFDFNAKSESKADIQPPAPAAAPVKAFDWAAVGMKPISTGNTGNWICSMCGLQNPGSAKDKCTICDTPR